MATGSKIFASPLKYKGPQGVIYILKFFLWNNISLVFLVAFWWNFEKNDTVVAIATKFKTSFANQLAADIVSLPSRCKNSMNYSHFPY